MHHCLGTRLPSYKVTSCGGVGKPDALILLVISGIRNWRMEGGIINNSTHLLENIVNFKSLFKRRKDSLMGSCKTDYPFSHWLSASYPKKRLVLYCTK